MLHILKHLSCYVIDNVLRDGHYCGRTPDRAIEARCLNNTNETAFRNVIPSIISVTDITEIIISLHDFYNIPVAPG